MGFLSVLGFARQLLSQRLQPGDTAIDATVGTGADTLFLAEACGRKGHVFGFDIQAEALSLASQRLAGEDSAKLAKVALYERNHADMEGVIPPEHHGRIGAVMFNLGYLPTDEADKGMITVPETTIPALEASLRLLRPRGVLSVVLYPGHEGGDLEATLVESWAASLPSSMGQSVIYRQIQRQSAPYVIAVEKKA